MPELELLQIETIYLGVIISIISIGLLISYRLTHPNVRNYNISVIFMAVDLVIMLFVAEKYLWPLFIVFLILITNISIGTIMKHFLKTETDKLLIDKEPQVWEKYEIAPELKKYKEDRK